MNFRIFITIAALTSSAAHAYDFDEECFRNRAWLVNEFNAAETLHQNVVESMQKSESIWKAVFYNDKEKEKIQALADAKRSYFLLASTSTREALNRAKELRKSIDQTHSRLDSMLSLGKREYDVMRSQLISAKIELEIVKGLSEDCNNAQAVYDDAYQSAYLGNPDANHAKRKKLIDALQFHSLQQLEAAVENGERDRNSTQAQIDL